MKVGEVVPFTGVVNSGGLATRAPRDMAPLGDGGEVLKALAVVGDPPIPLIEHSLNTHLRNNASSVIASVGKHRRVADHVAMRYAGRHDISSFQVDQALGTGGDLLQLVRNREIAEYIGPLVVVTNVDTIADVNLQALVQFHQQTDRELTIALSTLANVPNESAYLVGGDHQVVYSREAYSNPRTEQEAALLMESRGSSTGVVVAKTEFLKDMPWSPEDGPLSLYRDIVGHAVAEGAMSAFNNGSRFFIDLGTEEQWRKVQGTGLLQPYLCYEETS